MQNFVNNRMPNSQRERKWQNNNVYKEHNSYKEVILNILELWKENADYVLNVCKRFVKNPAIAEDIRQEVFLRIISSTELFKELSSIKTWLYSIAFRCCMDYFRTRKRQGQIEEECLRQGSLFLSDSLSPMWIVGKVSRVPCPISQLFVELSFGEGWSSEEIANVFGFSKGYVSKKIQEGIEQLQKIIE
jgi:RNA polymerase sigma-70 factor (ECF subfamily)